MSISTFFVSIALASSLHLPAAGVDAFAACTEEAQIVAAVVQRRDEGTALEDFLIRYVKPEYQADPGLIAFLSAIWASKEPAEAIVRGVFMECLAEYANQGR